MSKLIGKGVVLNWRGPLLATGVFVAGFALLLLMAHQNQSKTSDMGSSFREDPYGTSLLFDSYGRAGYQVRRSQDQDSLPDQDAQKTTAFFVGGYSTDSRFERGKLRVGEKFRKKLEDFLARGGRVVLIAPVGKLKSDSQGWEIENEWRKEGHDPGPGWVSPHPESMPVGSEAMYLGSDSPWLKVDAGWIPLYARTQDAKPESSHVYMAMRKVGNGDFIVASQESFLLNETIKTRPNPVLLDFLVGSRPVVWVDETLHGLHQDEGVLWLVQRYRLQAALLLFWATLLALLWSMNGDLIRRPSRISDAQIVRYGEDAGIPARRLLQRSVSTAQVLKECWEQFCRRSPEDAKAIVADPEYGTRLRTALSQSPLVGYKQLSEIIAERRRSAKGLVRHDRVAPRTPISSQQRDS